jgi:Transposase and inactivated derivatives
VYFDMVSGDDVWMVELDLSGAVGAGPRRRRSAVERRRVVEETLEAGASVAKVALKYGVNANQVFQWRRLYREGKLGVSSSNTMKLLPVSVVEVEETPSRDPVDVACVSSGAIHIELPGEIRISLEGSVDQDIVRTVLKSLRA